MNILISFLLSTSCNFDTMFLSSCLEEKEIGIVKNDKLIISILTSLATFFSILIGYFFNKLISQNYSCIFSGMCLSFLGLYYFINHIKISEEKSNFDTSYYVQDLDKSRLINNVVQDMHHKRSNLNFNASFKLSYYLLFDNFIIGFLVGISLINISLVTFFNFILTLIILSFYKYINSSFLQKYCNLINGSILFVLGIMIILL